MPHSSSFADYQDGRPDLLGRCAVLPLLFLDQTLTRLDGAMLFTGIIAYTWFSVIQSRKANATQQSDVNVPIASRHWSIDTLVIAASLGILVLGSRLLVDNAIILAKAWGVSDAVIGLTIVAAGTSMPELATSVVAAIRKQPDIAIGNIVGSNIFNILAILGLASIVVPIHAPGISGLDLVVMIVFTTLLIPMLYTGRLLHRVEGFVLLLLYAGYLVALWPK